jgi:hypothetical protein
MTRFSYARTLLLGARLGRKRTISAGLLGFAVTLLWGYRVVFIYGPLTLLLALGCMLAVRRGEAVTQSARLGKFRSSWPV